MSALRTGTLELLVFMPMDGETLDYAFALSWLDYPPSASWGAPYVYDLNLGDSEAKGLPSLPDAPGLWLLRWDWRETRDEDEWEDCFYADVCTWSRPTMDDIERLTTRHPHRPTTPTRGVSDARS